jgi:hypothetical protein
MIGIASLTDTKNVKNMIVTLLFLQMTMVGVFAALDAIVFYIFWELSLVPMLYIIGAWGGPLRIYASVKFGFGKGQCHSKFKGACYDEKYKRKNKKLRNKNNLF